MRYKKSVFSYSFQKSKFDLSKQGNTAFLHLWIYAWLLLNSLALSKAFQAEDPVGTGYFLFFSPYSEIKVKEDLNLSSVAKPNRNLAEPETEP